jgi:hypothetical protein
MTTKHLSESEIQQYALDKAGCEAAIAAHVETCKDCRDAIAGYQLLFSTLSEQSKPAFDFDLRGLVLPQLSPAKTKTDVFLVCFFAFLVLAAIGIPVYLFRKYLSELFAGILPMTMYLILVTAVIILIFQGIEMFKKYQKQMDVLNFN